MKITITFISGNVIFKCFNILLPVYIISSFIAVIIILHSLLRPVATELLQKKQNIVATDGYMGNPDGEEETLIFEDNSIVSQASSRFDNRSELKKRNTSHSLVMSLS